MIPYEKFRSHLKFSSNCTVFLDSITYLLKISKLYSKLCKKLIYFKTFKCVNIEFARSYLTKTL